MINLFLLISYTKVYKNQIYYDVYPVINSTLSPLSLVRLTPVLIMINKTSYFIKEILILNYEQSENERSELILQK